MAYPPMFTFELPDVICPVPLWAFRASPTRAAGFPLMNTEELPTFTLPLLCPQQLSRSVVMLPAVAAALPLMNTFGEHPPVMLPVNGSGP